MIIGNGLIAKTFSKYKFTDELTIFASGVSDSQETNTSSFLREQDLLMGFLNKAGKTRFVYFSSCDVINENNNSPYYVHKRKIEKLIANATYNYTIFRLPQVIGAGGNNANLVNFLKSKIINGEKFDLHLNHHKSIIHINDVLDMCCYILDNNMYIGEVVNIVNYNYIKMSNLVSLIEGLVQKDAIVNKFYDVKGVCYDDSCSAFISGKIGIEFDENYLYRALRKK